MTIAFDKIPTALKQRDQWVLWRSEGRNGDETKVPYSVDGRKARANDPATWSSFETVVSVFNGGKYTGIGFEFSADDPFVGIDLDGCRNAETGELAEWAKEVIRLLNTYGEVSPSQTGVKLFAIGKLPELTWKKRTLDEPKLSDKTPAIELYDSGRYFAVTGQRGDRSEHEPQERQAEVSTLVELYRPQVTESVPDFRSASSVVERSRSYMQRVPAAVSGQSGHNVTFRAACVLILGFALSNDEAFSVLAEWNTGCQPPWSERELRHKIDDANKQAGERGYLRNAKPDTWDSIRLPEYQSPPQKYEPTIITLEQAALGYLDRVKYGADTLLETGLRDLDSAIGGGIEPGEMVILAARPSHGKSAVALQMIHHWTSLGKPCLLISEEMSSHAIGKRTLQFLSDVPERGWRNEMQKVEAELKFYARERAACYVSESCRTAEAASEQIERAVEQFNVECVIVDYAGLLQSPGKSRYEQMTNTSIAMRQTATRHKVVLLLQCQLSREIEKRPTFSPLSSDLRDTGQLEQDADVIIFCCWPSRIDKSQPTDVYQFFVTKNRNRAMTPGAVQCTFDPSRQAFASAKPENYVDSFDAYNASELV